MRNFETPQFSQRIIQANTVNLGLSGIPELLLIQKTNHHRTDFSLINQESSNQELPLLINLKLLPNAAPFARFIHRVLPFADDPLQTLFPDELHQTIGVFKGSAESDSIRCFFAELLAVVCRWACALSFSWKLRRAEGGRETADARLNYLAVSKAEEGALSSGCGRKEMASRVTVYYVIG